MSQTPIHFHYADRELILAVSDLLAAPVEVIVNAADAELTHGEATAQRILDQAGDRLRQESDQLRREYGRMDTGMALFTTAGDMSHKAVIHAVMPVAGEEDAQRKIALAVSRSLLLCEANDWRSIAFSALGTRTEGVSTQTCARAFFRAIVGFWDARHESAVEKVVLCLDEGEFGAFVGEFRQEAAVSDASPDPAQPPAESREPPAAGQVELSEGEMADLNEGDLKDWFK